MKLVDGVEEINSIRDMICITIPKEPYVCGEEGGSRVVVRVPLAVAGGGVAGVWWACSGTQRAGSKEPQSSCCPTLMDETPHGMLVDFLVSSKLFLPLSLPSFPPSLASLTPLLSSFPPSLPSFLPSLAPSLPHSLPSSISVFLVVFFVCHNTLVSAYSLHSLFLNFHFYIVQFAFPKIRTNE